MFDGKKNNKLANIKCNCSSVNEIINCVKYSAEHHQPYYIYYRSFNIVENIVDAHSLILRNDNFNDLEDEKHLQQDKDGLIKFAICFCASRTESVAMWYMYGGDLKTNVRMCYTKEMLKKIIEHNNAILSAGIFSDNTYKEIMKISIEKHNIFISDVLYYEDMGKNIKIKVNNYIANINVEIFKKIPKYLLKYISWEYERECRIIVEIKKELLEKDINAVKLEIPNDIVKQIKEKPITLSPTIKEFNREGYHFCESKLKGKVNLIKDNKTDGN